MVATRGYFRTMIAVAVKELKNRLSQYLRQVAAGEIVLVTDRGRVVAELRRPSTERVDFDPSLESLASQGLLELGLPQDSRAYRRSGVTLRRPSQALLDAERAEL
jgi:antitoxin (DNA-binding transcriptional repressor) of toxin-antitoxin stability system